MSPASGSRMRSRMNPRNGAMPVPPASMTIGVRDCLGRPNRGGCSTMNGIGRTRPAALARKLDAVPTRSVRSSPAWTSLSGSGPG